MAASSTTHRQLVGKHAVGAAQKVSAVPGQIFFITAHMTVCKGSFPVRHPDTQGRRTAALTGFGGRLDRGKVPAGTGIRSPARPPGEGAGGVQSPGAKRGYTSPCSSSRSSAAWYSGVRSL